MPKDEEEKTCSRLRNELRVSLEKIQEVEEENKSLKEELLHLKAQIASLQQQVDKKKYRCSKTSNGLSLDKQIPSNNAEESSVANSLINRIKFFEGQTTIKERQPRAAQLPPRPKYFPSVQNLGGKEALLSPTTPPPPPPPPPPPVRSRSMLSNAVRRVPEVVELYRTLTRKKGKLNTRTSMAGIPAAKDSRDMIGEIENRSAYLSAVKSDVLNQRKFIDFLSKEVESAAFRDISDVECFVKWLDEELSHLVDERAVLKHFPRWPEQKADAMREAAFNYRDLKNLLSEISSFQGDMNRPAPVVLKVIQALQDKLEHSIHNLEKTRDSTSKRYRNFKIPWQWMHNSGIIVQLKLGSLNLAKVSMRRVVTALQSDSCSEENDLLLQGVRFAFRVHQFVGGFDEESRHIFQELQTLADCLLYSVKQPEE